MKIKAILPVLIPAALLLASCAKDLRPGTDVTGEGTIPTEPTVAGQVIVKFDESLSDILDALNAEAATKASAEGASAAGSAGAASATKASAGSAGAATSGLLTRSGVPDIDGVLASIGGLSLERVFPPVPATEARTREAGLHLWYVVRFDESCSVEDAVAKLSALGQVQAATPVRTIMRTYGTEAKARPLSLSALAKASARQTSPAGQAPTSQDGPTVQTSVSQDGPAPASASWNDPLLSQQWHLVNNGGDGFTYSAAEDPGKFIAGSDVNCSQAWSLCTGDPSIIVAVLDEGVCLEHPDLQGSIWTNEDEIYGSETDNDGNGYAGDRYGYDFINDRGIISWNSYGDTGHGTHVAGVIAAVNDNGIGISSIAGGTPSAPGVKIMSCQVFSGSLSSSNTLYLVRAIKYAADNGAVILQCSWGYMSGECSAYEYGGQGFKTQEEWEYYCPLEKSALDYFIHNAGSPNGPIEGGIPVFASGNEYAPMAGFPGAAEGCISVAAVAADFTPSTFTNYGEYTKISAPGGDQDYYWDYEDADHVRGEAGCILSTLPYHISESGYGYMEGTSMACPHVSGVIALGLSYAAQTRRHFTAQEFTDLLLSTCSDLDPFMTGEKLYYKYQIDMPTPVQAQKMSLSSYRGRMGSGLVNAAALLQAIDGAGTPMSFPNVYVREGSTTTVAPARFFVGGDDLTYTVNIHDARVATVSAATTTGTAATGTAATGTAATGTAATGSVDSAGAVGSAVEGAVMLVFSGVNSGSTTANITASNGVSYDFVITVRTSDTASGWL